MIEYIPPKPRRRWPGVLVLAVVLVVFLLLISACGPSRDQRFDRLEHRVTQVECELHPDCYGGGS